MRNIAFSIILLVCANLALAETAAKKSILIVGMAHNNEIDDNFQSLMVRKASNKKAVVGLESLERNKEDEEEFMQAAYGLEKGFAFGVENDFSIVFSGTLLHYGYFAIDMTDKMYTAKFQLAYELKMSAAMKRNWEQLGKKKLNEETGKIYKLMDNYISDYGHLDARTLIQQLQGIIESFGDNAAWQELFKELSIVMTDEAARLPENTRPDISRIQDYIENPTNYKAQAYVVEEVNGKWRDSMIAKNMADIAAIAVQNDLNAYFLIGRSHVDNLTALLNSYDLGLPIKVYYSTQSVPEEFLSDKSAS
ncbi:hypothetical protein ACFL6Y_09990 [Elusimicrobiota bacterium]